MRKLLLILGLFALSLGSNADVKFKFGENVNPQGVAFEVDGKGFVVGGNRILPVMGEIHYARVPEKEWRREICKMRAGGVSIIATYIFWIHHEGEQGKWDWSGNRNLRRFVQICGEEGIPVVLRIGPFCHGEVYQGGFPDWLVSKAQMDPKRYKLRSLAPGFIEETEKLYNNIAAQVRGLMWKDGGPIVGVQIENECRGPWDYLVKLKTLAENAGFNVPFFTRTGWPKLNGKAEFGKLLPLYGDYADGFWDRKLTDMPGEYKDAFIFKKTRLSGVIATETFGNNQDTQMERSDLSYPYLTCELGGGMMPSYHRRINISGREMLPLAVCKVGSGSNLPGYYMYHGGTNPYNQLHTMAETQASAVTNYNDMPVMSYDFQAPLGEMGQINPVSFHEGRWFHQFLADWGDALSLAEVDSLSDNYAHRGQFVFRNDYVRIINENGHASVTPDGMEWGKMKITSSSIQPFAKADGQLYFIPVPGLKKYQAVINGKRYTFKPNRPLTVNGKTLCLLSFDTAKTAYVIDGKMHFARNGGIVYKMNGKIVEEVWTPSADMSIIYNKVKEASKLRIIKVGQQKVAAMPVDSDFDNAAIWEIQLPENAKNDDFIELSYLGDCARIYADGRLIADNFWNGKTFLVRVSDLLGKKIELRILPFSDTSLIYYQKEQKPFVKQGKAIVSSMRIIRRITL